MLLQTNKQTITNNIYKNANILKAQLHQQYLNLPIAQYLATMPFNC